jgi:hypothetical protein
LHLGLFDVYITRRGFGFAWASHTIHTTNFLCIGLIWSFEILALSYGTQRKLQHIFLTCISTSLKDEHSDNHYYFTTFLCTLWSWKKFFHCKSDREITESDITIFRALSHVLSRPSRASSRFLGWRVWMWSPRTFLATTPRQVQGTDDRQSLKESLNM